MSAWVFYTGMKELSCLKNASLSFLIMPFRKALTLPFPPLKALLSNGSLSQVCLLRAFVASVWAQVGTGTYEVYQGQLPLCMPCTCCGFCLSCLCLIPTCLLHVHTQLLVMLWTCWSWFPAHRGSYGPECLIWSTWNYQEGFSDCLSF